MPGACQVLFSHRWQEKRNIWKGGEGGLGLGPFLPPWRWGGEMCVFMCSCCRFSMARVPGQLRAGLRPSGGQEGPMPPPPKYFLLWSSSPGGVM